METLRALKYSIYVIGRPFDGFWDLKNEKRGNISGALILLLGTIVTFILSKQFTGFLFNKINLKEFNILIEICSVLIPFILWCVANWCLTTLMDGKGTFKDIVIATSYAMTPLILINLPLIIASNVMIVEEGAFYYFFLNCSNIWFIALVIIGTMSIHHYSMIKTIITCFLTIVGMGIMIFIGLLFFNLIEEMMLFINTLYREIIFRL